MVTLDLQQAQQNLPALAESALGGEDVFSAAAAQQQISDVDFCFAKFQISPQRRHPLQPATQGSPKLPISQAGGRLP
jgi:hypothetical protein